MTKTQYIERVASIVSQFDPKKSNRYFLFGSSVRKERYGDIDLGVVGNKTAKKNLSELREYFYDSSIPYKVDVVDFDTVSQEFSEYVLKKEPIVWLN